MSLMGKLLRHLTVGLALAGSFPILAPAQTGTATELIRPTVSRADLELRLREIDQWLTSPGYSEMLREGRRTEAAAIRDRLKNGDLRPGDRLQMVVQQNAPYSREYEVTPNRTIILPSGDQISVAGLLRSELADSLAVRLRPYFVDPQVQTTTSIRVQIMGAVGNNGFFSAPATDLLSTVLMEKAGGISRNVNLAKSQIRRGDQVVVTGSEFQLALREGRSLDALSVQGGDEIFLAEKPSSNIFFRVLGAIGAMSSAIFVLDRIGVF